MLPKCSGCRILEPSVNQTDRERTPRLSSHRSLALAGLVCLTLAACSGRALPPAASQIPVTPVASLDLPRYMGTWYEIAKYPNWFQTKCAGGTNALYSLQSDGRVRVVNRCRRENGDWDEALGEARPVGAAGTATLEVRFAPVWLSWLPAVWGDYWVIDLDPGYRLAAVSEPARDYLWILSRTPSVDPAAYQALLHRLEGQGFDLARLERTQP